MDDDIVFDQEQSEEVEESKNVVDSIDNTLLTPPSIIPTLNYEYPRAIYEPYHIYGYRGYDSRNNLFFTAEGNLVYPMAALGVVLNTSLNSQIFFGGKKLGSNNNQHDDDIVCMAISKTKTKAATGQIGVNPKLFIWGTNDGKFIAKYVLKKDKYTYLGIIACSFSENEKCVALIDMCCDHNVHVVNAETGALQWIKPSTKIEVCDICWRGNSHFAISGKNNILFWNYSTQSYIPSKELTKECYGCIIQSKEAYYTGTSIGNVYEFNDSVIIHKFKNIHNGKIIIIRIHSPELITGGDDMKIVFHNLNSKHLIRKINCNEIPRSIDFFDRYIAIGTNKNSIILYDSYKETYRWSSHFDGEVRGLAITEKYIITSGEDNQIMLWDYKACQLIITGEINEVPGAEFKKSKPDDTKFPTNQCSRSISYNNIKGEIAVGVNNGEVHILDLKDITICKKVIKCGDESIYCLAYAPRGNMLAVGSKNSEILIFRYPDYDLRKKFTFHKASIIAIDWSMDGKWLRTLDKSFHMNFFDIEALELDKIGSTSTKDIKWKTQNCKIGWNVRGIYPPNVDKKHINGVCKSKDEKILAVGDDWGFVNIYNNPCAPKSKFISLRGHSEHVPSVAFSDDGQFLFSVGGKDKAIIQWKIGRAHV